MNKIFLIGAQRTGTASVAEALNILGIRTSHFQHHEEILQGINENDFKFKVLEEFDALADLPVPVIFRELDKVHPNSKFILTVRDVKNWIAGIENQVRDRRLLPVEYIFYKVWKFDKGTFVKRYLDHNMDVMQYFKGRPEDLLIFDLSIGNEWEKLCSFLGKDIPKEPFPHKVWGRYASNPLTYGLYKRFPSLYVKLAKLKDKVTTRMALILSNLTKDKTQNKAYMIRHKRRKSIPHRFFLFWSGQDFQFVNFLCVLSLLKTNRVDELTIFVEEEPKNNLHWDRLKNLDPVRLVQLDFAQLVEISGLKKEDLNRFMDVAAINHKSDLFRYLVLYAYGGIYIDFDCLIIRDVSPLLRTECFVGVQSHDNKKEQINGAVLGAVQGARLLFTAIEEVFEICRKRSKLKWSELGPHLLEEIITRRCIFCRFFFGLLRRTTNRRIPRSLIIGILPLFNLLRGSNFKVYPESYFYYFPYWKWEKIFSNTFLPRRAYVIHLWAKMSSDYTKNVNLEFLQRSNCLYARRTRKVLGKIPKRQEINLSGLNNVRIASMVLLRKTLYLCLGDHYADYRKSILVSGIGKSGTTWLAEIINYKKDYRYLFEPFHPKRSDIWKKYKYKLYLRPNDADQHAKEVVEKILSGIITNRRIEQFNDKFIYHKRLIKESFANLLLGYIHANFPAIRIILLMRHPCAVARSQVEGGHWFQPVDFLANKELVEDFLHPFEKEIRKSKGPFEKSIFSWCVSYYVPLKEFKSEEIYLAFYENLCVNPMREIERLYSFLGEDYDKGICQELVLPSASYQSYSAIMRGENLVDAWMRYVNKMQLERTVEILSIFGLDKIYSQDPMPNVNAAYNMMVHS